MLGVGIDWAEEFHLVALGSPGEGAISVLQAGHRPGAVSALVERIAGLEADPAEVRVVIETRHGLLVEALVEAGYTVLPVNPELVVSRRRGLCVPRISSALNATVPARARGPPAARRRSIW